MHLQLERQHEHRSQSIEPHTNTAHPSLTRLSPSSQPHDRIPYTISTPNNPALHLIPHQHRLRTLRTLLTLNRIRIVTLPPSRPNLHRRLRRRFVQVRAVERAFGLVLLYLRRVRTDLTGLECRVLLLAAAEQEEAYSEADGEGCRYTCSDADFGAC
jgi:hypothetical protein